MTMPEERTRAMRQARELVDLLLKTPNLPEEIRLRAEGVDRHFPTAEDIAGQARYLSVFPPANAHPWLLPEDTR